MARIPLTAPAGLTDSEARALSRKFCVRMGRSKDDVNVYWSPARRDIVSRSAFNPCGAIPSDSVLVGCYRPPYPATLFLADLSATIQGGA